MTALRLSDEVRAALAERRAVVALESTLVAHGLPWPENLEVGRAAEATVREAGAVPATVAVLDGSVTVGVDAASLERIARGKFRKANQSDLAVAVAQKRDAATTVSATAFAAARAGIALFATGGIGGVHRVAAGHGAGWNDVSSDLTTLGRESIAVVSAGAKAILDLPATVEALETLGVLLVGYQTSELPAFYTRRSGIALEHRADDAQAVARLIAARRALGDPAGMLVANPIPVAAALDEKEVARTIDAALDDAARAGISGKALTPHLLAALARLTDGKSLVANRALVLNNCRVAAEIAVAFSKLP